MFRKFRRRLETAFRLAHLGAKAEAMQVLLMGATADDMCVRTTAPLMAENDFYDLTARLGLERLGRDYPVGEKFEQYVGDEDKPQNICLEIEIDDETPSATFSILGRITSIYVNIKHNPDTGLYQIDDATIMDHSAGIDDSVIYNVPVDADQNGKRYLPDFVKIFARTAERIMNATPITQPAAIELEMAQSLKPMIDDLIELERMEQEAFRNHQRAIGGPGGYTRS